MEEEQYPFQIAYFHLKFNKYEEEPDFCLKQSRVLRQSDRCEIIHIGFYMLFVNSAYIITSHKS